MPFKPFIYTITKDDADHLIISENKNYYFANLLLYTIISASPLLALFFWKPGGEILIFIGLSFFLMVVQIPQAIFHAKNILKGHSFIFNKKSKLIYENSNTIGQFSKVQKIIIRVIKNGKRPVLYILSLKLDNALSIFILKTDNKAFANKLAEKIKSVTESNIEVYK